MNWRPIFFLFTLLLACPNALALDSPQATLENALEDLVNDVTSNVIANAKSAGVEVAAEVQILLLTAISAIRNCYEKELDTTLDKVSDEVKDAIDQVRSLIALYTQPHELEDIRMAIQQFLSTLPFANKQPQLTEVSPRAILPTFSEEFLINLRGSFIGNTGQAPPTLNFGDQTCLLLDSTTQTLTFQCPVAIFPEEAHNQYVLAKGKFDIDWQESCWLIRKCSRKASFYVALLALPKIAGLGTVTHQWPGSQRLFSNKAKNYPFNGNDYYPTAWKVVAVNIYPDDGWSIDASTVKVVPHWEHGKYQEAPTFTVTPALLILEVRLYCATGHDMSIVNIDVSFGQYQDQPIVNQRQEQFLLAWEGSQLLVPQPNELITQVDFVDYRGVQWSFAGPETNDRCVLWIEAEGNGIWSVFANPPSLN